MESESGEELRRVHVIYFLSRKGRIEHPHLINVHHFSKDISIHLRDVKRWLTELRGKDMPESFAWSYKRKYKCGYVWEDLVDEDPITPISENEYVLKGYEISSFSSNKDYSDGDQRKAVKQKELSLEVEEAKQKPKELFQMPMVIMSRKSRSDIEESPIFGSKTSTLKLKEENRDLFKLDQESTKVENSWTKSLTMEKSSVTSPSSTPCGSSSFSKSKGASQIIRNIITCGLVEINESAKITIKQRNKPSFNISYSNKVNKQQVKVTKKDMVVGATGSPSPKILWNQTQQKVAASARKSSVGLNHVMDDSRKLCSPMRSSPSTSKSASYMPINGPTCSQCGKQFKPEKLQKHMKSCSKGVKAAIGRAPKAYQFS